MHRRSLLASEKSKSAVVASIERPTPSKNQTASRNSAFITRSNNPNNKKEVNKPKFAKGIRGGKPRETSASPENSTTSDKEEIKSEVQEQATEFKLPPYLAFIVNGLYYIGSYPVAFVCKTYSVICFVINIPSLTYAWLKYLIYELPLNFLEKSVKFAKEVPAKVLVWLANNLQGLIEICALYQLGGLCLIALAFWICPLPSMTYPLFSILRLVLGTLYPAYASYKAVRTKDVKEYVKWMMYWIVFAIFTSVETFADIFVAFWFPFYYEVKILLLIWLISPVSRGSLGSSILYRRFVHPSLIAREEEIDRMILRLQEQGYNTVTKLAVKAFNYASNMVMQTAIRAPVLVNEFIEAQRLQQNDPQRSVRAIDTTDNRADPRFGGGGLVHQLRKSYSLTDLGHDENDYGATITEHRAITSDPETVKKGSRDGEESKELLASESTNSDEIAELEHRRRTGSAGRSGPVRYVRHISHDTERQDQAVVPRRRSSRSRDSPRSGGSQQNRDVDDMSSSGYSSLVNAEYYPVNTETMDTGDYELYDPRIHARARLVQPRGPSSKAKTKEEATTAENNGKTENGYQLSHSTSISHSADNPSNWSSEYSRNSSISSGSIYIKPLDTDQDEVDTETAGVLITEYESDSSTRARNISSPSWLEKEMSERKQQTYQNSPVMKRSSSRQSLTSRRNTQEIIVVKQQAPARPSSRTSMSASYPGFQPGPGNSRPGSFSVSGTDTEEDVLISDFEDKEKTPMPAIIQNRQFVTERPPPAVAMARRRPSWEERVERLPYQPPRPASRGPGSRRRTQEIVVSQPPRPASRASGGGLNYYEGRRPGYELSRSPSEISTTSTIMSDMSSVSSANYHDRESTPTKNDNSFKGKCPHCYIHSWLPHSPSCPKKKSPTMGLYRDPTHARAKTPGQESYPTTRSTISSQNSRTLPKKPRPKSLVMGSSDIAKMKKYKSVVSLKQSDFKSDYPQELGVRFPATSPTISAQNQNYQRNYVPRASPTKSTSPTHEALARSARKNSFSSRTTDGASSVVQPPMSTRMITSSEYYSMSHSSEYESDPDA